MDAASILSPDSTRTALRRVRSERRRPKPLRQIKSRLDGGRHVASDAKYLAERGLKTKTGAACKKRPLRGRYWPDEPPDRRSPSFTAIERRFAGNPLAVQAATVVEHLYIHLADLAVVLMAVRHVELRDSCSATATRSAFQRRGDHGPCCSRDTATAVGFGTTTARLRDRRSWPMLVRYLQVYARRCDDDTRPHRRPFCAGGRLCLVKAADVLPCNEREDDPVTGNALFVVHGLGRRGRASGLDAAAALNASNCRGVGSRVSRRCKPDVKPHAARVVRGDTAGKIPAPTTSRNVSNSDKVGVTTPDGARGSYR